jgi:phage-related protein
VYFSDVESFISSLDPVSKGHIFHLVEMLKKYGLNLRPPESKKLTKGLYELRVQGRLKIRVLYTVRGDKAYLLSIFVKKSPELPKNEIRKASHRIKLLD